MTILISDQVDFRAKKITTIKKGHYIINSQGTHNNLTWVSSKQQILKIYKAKN